VQVPDVPKLSTRDPQSHSLELSALQENIIRDLAQSLPNTQIANRQNVSPAAVTENIKKIKQAFGTTKLSEVVQKAIEKGFIAEPLLADARTAIRRYRIEEMHGLNARTQQLMILYAQGLSSAEVQAEMGLQQAGTNRIKLLAERTLGVTGIDQLIKKGLELDVFPEDLKSRAQRTLAMQVFTKTERDLLLELANGTSIEDLVGRPNGQSTLSLLNFIRKKLVVPRKPAEFILKAAFDRGMLDRTPAVERAQSKIRIMERFNLSSLEFDRLQQAAEAVSAAMFAAKFSPVGVDWAEKDYESSVKDALAVFSVVVGQKMEIPAQQDVLHRIGMAVQRLDKEGAWTRSVSDKPDAWWKKLRPREAPTTQGRQPADPSPFRPEPSTLEKQLLAQSVKAGFVDKDGRVLDRTELSRFRTAFLDYGMTLREFQIARAVEKVASLKQLATMFPSTAETLQIHLSRIMSKMGLLPQYDFDKNRLAITQRLTRSPEGFVQSPPDIEVEAASGASASGEQRSGAGTEGPPNGSNRTDPPRTWVVGGDDKRPPPSIADTLDPNKLNPTPNSHKLPDTIPSNYKKKFDPNDINQKTSSQPKASPHTGNNQNLGGLNRTFNPNDTRSPAPNNNDRDPADPLPKPLADALNALDAAQRSRPGSGPAALLNTWFNDLRASRQSKGAAALASLLGTRKGLTLLLQRGLGGTVLDVASRSHSQSLKNLLNLDALRAMATDATSPVAPVARTLLDKAQALFIARTRALNAPPSKPTATPALLLKRLDTLRLQLEQAIAHRADTRALHTLLTSLARDLPALLRAAAPFIKAAAASAGDFNRLQEQLQGLLNRLDNWVREPQPANSDDINGVIKVIGYLLNFLGAPQPARGH
jgi:DNA-binding NarL/FixJ family response regulator